MRLLLARPKAMPACSSRDVVPKPSQLGSSRVAYTKTALLLVLPIEPPFWSGEVPTCHLITSRAIVFTCSASKHESFLHPCISVYNERQTCPNPKSRRQRKNSGPDPSARRLRVTSPQGLKNHLARKREGSPTHPSTRRCWLTAPRADVAATSDSAEPHLDEHPDEHLDIPGASTEERSSDGSGSSSAPDQLEPVGSDAVASGSALDQPQVVEDVRLGDLPGTTTTRCADART